MGRVTKIIFVCILLVVNGLRSQEDSIKWSEDIVLNWENFKGTPNEMSNAAALTASGISYNFSAEMVDGTIHVISDINAFFYPDKSWYKPDICDANILNHERLHFDIAALFALKMRHEVKNTSFTENVKKEFRELYKNTIKELKRFQEVYDKETDFSRNTTQQERWNSQIREHLKKEISRASKN